MFEYIRVVTFIKMINDKGHEYWYREDNEIGCSYIALMELFIVILNHMRLNDLHEGEEKFIHKANVKE